MMVGMGSIPVCLSISRPLHVDLCSRKLTGEGNTQSALWLTGEVMKLLQLDTTSMKGALNDSSFFLFLVNIDYDAKPQDFFSQGIWGGLYQIEHLLTLSEA